MQTAPIESALHLAEVISLNPAFSAGTAPTTFGADTVEELLARGAQRLAGQGRHYAGTLLPQEAWTVIAAGAGSLVDVRTLEEWRYVGRVPNALHLPWQTGTALTRNPRFTRELEAKVGKGAVIVMLCRSGNRSADAAEAAAKAGFQHVYNVLEGFEGERDENGHRGTRGGWRAHGLPWEQD